MEWTTKLLQLPLLCGVVFSIAATIMYVFPPKKINNWYGYRTSSSMKSEERWQFAQRFSSIKMMVGGCFLVVASFLGLLIKVDEKTQLVLGTALPLLTVFYILWSTERSLKNKFPNS
ncbi:SdpI family protein [Flavobacterium sp. SM15]|uniref:SdpI family protein n=1 Tax=Flavobacterium sp. SM15 TaxID=2908005 RepID=UPI001EDB791E|nr:SdpI family protein [Flavobacterium sp. SM15]MCG2610380.1 SdpI family protein [Flavobacterium sp. SM15]